MADTLAIPPFTPSYAFATLAFDPIASLAGTDSVSATDNVLDLSPADQTDEALLNGVQSLPASDFQGNDGLVNIDTSSFLLINSIGSDPTSPNITGNLTTQQLQEIGILQHDMQILEEAANLNLPLPLNNGSDTLDLSVTAQDIAAGITPATGVATPSTVTPVATNLTAAQVELLANTLGPLANVPLTNNTLAQIQAQLELSNIGAEQLNLNTIFIVMSYIAAMQPASSVAIEASKNEQQRESKKTVSPVSSIDAVAVEDSAIL